MTDHMELFENVAIDQPNSIMTLFVRETPCYRSIDYGSWLTIFHDQQSDKPDPEHRIL